MLRDDGDVDVVGVLRESIVECPLHESLSETRAVSIDFESSDLQMTPRGKRRIDIFDRFVLDFEIQKSLNPFVVMQDIGRLIGLSPKPALKVGIVLFQ